PAQQLGVFGTGVVQGRDRLVLGDEQHVHRRLRRDVLEAEDVLVLVDDGRRDFAADDLAEDGVAHGPYAVGPGEAAYRSRGPCPPGRGRCGFRAFPSGCQRRARACRGPRIPARRPAAGPGPGGWGARRAGAPAAPGNARWPRPRPWRWWR